MIGQLPLAVQLNDHATLADFCWKQNQLLQNTLLQMLSNQGERFFYIWGTVGSGKSHILQACCQAMSVQNYSVIYLPLRILKEWGPQVLDGVNQHHLVAIDDIEAVAGQVEWEEALFHLYNRIRDQASGVCMITSPLPVMDSSLNLADLRSRLTWGLVIQLHGLDDADKIDVLQSRAQKRGFKLSRQVCQYLLNHCVRNMHDLLQLLDQLDQASLAAQRKITIPFVKNTLKLGA